jgi:hypothetical protein
MRSVPWEFGGPVKHSPTVDPWAQQKQRVCSVQGCGTVLSIYNPSTYCWLHDGIRVYARPGPQERSKARADHTRSPIHIR